MGGYYLWDNNLGLVVIIIVSIYMLSTADDYITIVLLRAMKLPPSFNTQPIIVSSHSRTEQFQIILFEISIEQFRETNLFNPECSFVHSSSKATPSNR